MVDLSKKSKKGLTNLVTGVTQYVKSACFVQSIPRYLRATFLNFYRSCTPLTSFFFRLCENNALGSNALDKQAMQGLICV